ncbi:MAG: hypothetical protein AAF787_14350 [Chloroflexota bacterium]
MPEPTITPQEFVNEWRGVTLKERQAYQTHFVSLCNMIGVRRPGGTGTDAAGNIFMFEHSIEKEDGSRGYVDAYYQNHFAIEYKAPDKYNDLADAYNQIKAYRQNLNNVPLLVVRDINRWEIHAHFDNARYKKYEFLHEDILKPGTRMLTALFTEPQKLNPNLISERVTLGQFCGHQMCQIH